MRRKARMSACASSMKPANCARFSAGAFPSASLRNHFSRPPPNARRRASEASDRRVLLAELADSYKARVKSRSSALSTRAVQRERRDGAFARYGDDRVRHAPEALGLPGEPCGRRPDPRESPGSGPRARQTACRDRCRSNPHGLEHEHQVLGDHVAARPESAKRTAIGRPRAVEVAHAPSS